HDVTFDASGLTSGVYVYRLTAGNVTTSAKMVLTK
ncbi:MAG: T9SS C-terminal target domain-containing protein, partial [Candidatus Zixiibacteriota bacterium]